MNPTEEAAAALSGGQEMMVALTRVEVVEGERESAVSIREVLWKQS